jgi:autotransporter-associated beta strand protein
MVLSGNNTYTGPTILSAGTLSLAGGNAIADTGAVIVDAGTLDVQNNETIGSLAGAGNVVLNADLTTGDATDTTYSGVISGPGALVKQGAGSFTLSGPSSYTGSTTLSAGTLRLRAGNSLPGSSAVAIGDGGTLVVGADATVGQLVNDGTLRIQHGKLLVTGDCVQNAGGTQIDAGTTLSIAPGKVMRINGGTLSGNGTVEGDVVNGGTLTPGASPGTLTITGNYTQMSTGVLAVELAGVSQGVTYDLLKITGDASLAGALNVTLIGGFVPSPDDVFAIMTYSNVSGNFTNFTGGFAGASSAFYRLQAVSEVVTSAATNRSLPLQCQ